MDMQSKAKKLIEMIQTAPVEWKPLGEVCLIADNLRKPVKASLRVAGKIPYYGANNIQDYVDGYTHDGEFLLIAEDGSASLTNYSIQWVVGKFWANNHVHVVQGNKLLNNRFLFHYLRQMNFIPYLVGGDRAKLTKAKMLEIKIPIPSLETQQKIVKILDKFTELEATLEAELALRKRQYRYYRDFLLDFDNQIGGGIVDGYKGRLKDVVWKTLGEVGTLIRGNGLQKKDFTEDGIPAIHYGQIYTHYGTFASKTKSFVSTRLAEKLKKAQYGDVLIAGTSENIQDVMTPVGWLGGEIVFSGDMFAFRPNTEINTKYLTYMLQTTMFQKYKEKYAQGTKVIRVKGENFLKFEIPIPPLAEQEKITAILDKFDTLTNSISEGLPHEIALRRKQYEYYREQLLAFPKAA